MSMLAVLPAAKLPSRAPEQRWLVDQLWGAEAVGIIGGEPKCCKSLLALDLAVSVASGTNCLGRFPIARAARVLLFAAEDPLHVVRERLEGITAARGLTLKSLPLFVITAPRLRLDDSSCCEQLSETVEKAHPALLVLDPFVRLHAIDENNAGEVAPLLGFLRKLQRQHHLAVALVHHARKDAGRLRPGQALRGSSEFHAWGDSNLYLRRRDQTLRLSVEHRAARAPDDLVLELATEPLALRIADAAPPELTSADQPSPPTRIEQALLAAPAPLKARELRALCRLRSETLYATLDTLLADGRVIRTHDGYSLPA
jgi:hypothetical protein